MARSTSLYMASPPTKAIQEEDLSLAHPRARITSMTPPRRSTTNSATPSTSSSLSKKLSSGSLLSPSPSISLTTPSPLSKSKLQPINTATPPPKFVLGSITPSKQPAATPRATPKSTPQKPLKKGGSEEWSSPRGGQNPTKVLSNGTGTAVATDDGLGNAFWDGDDMSLEMITDVNDGDVDEEVYSVLIY